MAEGRIGIEPFDPGLMQPSSLDVRVDRDTLPVGLNLATLTIRSGTSQTVVDVEAIGTLIIVPP